MKIELNRLDFENLLLNFFDTNLIKHNDYDLVSNMDIDTSYIATDDDVGCTIEIKISINKNLSDEILFREFISAMLGEVINPIKNNVQEIYIFNIEKIIEYLEKYVLSSLYNIKNFDNKGSCEISYYIYEEIPETEFKYYIDLNYNLDYIL